MSALLYEKSGTVVTLTINRPDARNPLGEEGDGELFEDAAQRINSDRDIRCAILTGAGKAFSGGGDLNLLERMTKDLELREKIMDESRVLVRSMIEFPLPIVAAVHGAAVGLGCSLASMSDLVVMEEDSFFADPHVSLGLVAGDGGAITWPLHMGLQRTKEWLLLGGRIDAQQAYQFGLANRVVPRGEAVAEAKALAQRLAGLPQQALLETRRALNQPLVQRVDDLLEHLVTTESASFDEDSFRANLTRMLERSRK